MSHFLSSFLRVSCLLPLTSLSLKRAQPHLSRWRSAINTQQHTFVRNFAQHAPPDDFDDASDASDAFDPTDDFDDSHDDSYDLDDFYDGERGGGGEGAREQGDYDAEGPDAFDDGMGTLRLPHKQSVGGQISKAQRFKLIQKQKNRDKAIIKSETNEQKRAKKLQLKADKFRKQEDAEVEDDLPLAGDIVKSITMEGERDKWHPLTGHILNEHIHCTNVLLIDEYGKRLGQMTRTQALQLTREKKLDLLCLSNPAIEPVTCKMVNYKQFVKMEEKRKQETAKKQKQTQKEMKIIQFRSKIAVGDFNMKLNRMLEFLRKGHPVKFQSIKSEPTVTAALIALAVKHLQYDSVVDPALMAKEKSYVVLTPLSQQKRNENANKGLVTQEAAYKTLPKLGALELVENSIKSGGEQDKKNAALDEQKELFAALEAKKGDAKLSAAQSVAAAFAKKQEARAQKAKEEEIQRAKLEKQREIIEQIKELKRIEKEKTIAAHMQLQDQLSPRNKHDDEPVRDNKQVYEKFNVNSDMFNLNPNNPASVNKPKSTDNVIKNPISSSSSSSSSISSSRTTTTTPASPITHNKTQHKPTTQQTSHAQKQTQQNNNYKNNNNNNQIKTNKK